MEYQVEIYDLQGRRMAAYNEVPLIDAIRRAPDLRDEVQGILPKELEALGPAFRVRVLIEGALFCECTVEVTEPQWSDVHKLVLDKYVPFHEVVEVRARTEARAGNTTVSRAYTNREIGAILKDAINSAPGPIHYWVDHNVYPEGAEREYQKFLARKTEENELGLGGVSEGQWVGGSRIDLTSAYAKDGDTLAGIEVDGAAWPDLRLMLIDTEETTRNSHAVKRHPEVADWTDAAYLASAYKRKADAAKDLLQNLLDSKGIDYIELNPHRDATGAFDDRVDAYGRYIGMVYGGGECFNAALVEQDLADVYLWDEGRYHVPEHALKDFFSYVGPHAASIESTGVSLSAFDVDQGVLEVAAALAYAAGGFVFSVDAEFGLAFRRPAQADRVIFHDPITTGVSYGADASEMGNYLVLSGNPLSGAPSHTYSRGESIDAYGLTTRVVDFFSLDAEEDADRLAAGVLDDLAYPAPAGEVHFYRGNAQLRLGDIVEIRGPALRRLAPELADEWGGRFGGRMVARVRELRHRFTGKAVSTWAYLTSPLRSVEHPLSFIVRSQRPAAELFGFRLDDAKVGLDMGFHLD